MKGFTLIETSIALAIFAMIAGVIVGSIGFSSRVYEKSQEFMDLTQNNRIVLDSISRELRQAERVVTSLSNDKYNSEEEILFRDGHLNDITEKDTIQGGEDDILFLGNESSSEDGFYKDSYIKITGGSSNLEGEVRKIVNYEGENKRAKLNYPLEEGVDYFGIDYMIDTSYYYIHYFLDDDEVKRGVYAYYFSDDPDMYVPVDVTPPSGQTLEKEVLEINTIGEHFSQLRFWEDEAINIFVELEFGGRTLNFLRKVSGRNL